MIITMKINIYHLKEGALKAGGLTVIIDVFRAFSLECYAFHNGAKEILAVGELKTAFALKKEHPEYILLGERNEMIISGFDYGNSPTQILSVDLRKKTLVHTTSSGTQGLVNAVNATEIITGSFVNAGAILKYIRLKQPDRVSLVCMGYASLYPVEEDTFCAEYIRNELLGIKNDFKKMKEVIRQTSGMRFFDKDKQDHAPSNDFDLCLDLNRFDFIIRAERKDDLAVMKKHC